MRKYLLHICFPVLFALIISFVFLLAPTVQVATYAGELEDAKEKVRKYPDEAWAHGLLGVAYAELGKYEEAMESFKRAIRIDPDDADAHLGLAWAHNGLGNAYFRSGKYQEAINSLKQAIRIDPRSSQAHFALGGGYVAEGDRSSALEEYEILKKLDTKKANELFDMIYE